MKITDDVLIVLSTLKISGSTAQITEGKLDRKLYERVNKVLTELGGKWTKRKKCHVFPGDPTERLDACIESGEIETAQEMGYFPTPQWLAKDLVKAAKIKPGMTVLEPSAGDGALVVEAEIAGGQVTCVEIDPGRALKIRFPTPGKKFKSRLVLTGDFLEWETEDRFDRVVANPPFARRQDIHHVRKAFSYLAPNGRLVAIISRGVEFRQDRLSEAFRNFVEANNGTIDPLPDNAFVESGTRVRTVCVTMEKR